MKIPFIWLRLEAEDLRWGRILFGRMLHNFLKCYFSEKCKGLIILYLIQIHAIWIINKVTSHTYFLNRVTQLLMLGSFTGNKLKRINYPQTIMNYDSRWEFQGSFSEYSISDPIIAKELITFMIKSNNFI